MSVQLDVSALADDLLKTFAKAVKQEAKKIHPKLPDALRVQYSVKSGSDGISIEFDALYPERPWKFVIYGTRPHLICARLWKQCGMKDPYWKGASEVLVFRKDGKLVFARRVSHPGTKSKAKKVKDARRRVAEVMKEKVREVIGQ